MFHLKQTYKHVREFWDNGSGLIIEKDNTLFFIDKGVEKKYDNICPRIMFFNKEGVYIYAYPSLLYLNLNDFSEKIIVTFKNEFVFRFSKGDYFFFSKEDKTEKFRIKYAVVDKLGNIIFESEPRSPLFPILCNDGIISGDYVNRYKLFCYKAISSGLKWEIDFNILLSNKSDENVYLGVPKLFGNKLFVQVHHLYELNFLFCLNPDTGEIIWKIKDLAGKNYYTDNRIYTFSNDNVQINLLEFDFNGILLMKKDLTPVLVEASENTELSTDTTTFGYCIEKGYLYYGYYNTGCIGAIDLETNKIVWEDKIEITKESWQITDPKIVGNRLYFQDEGRVLYVYELISP